MPRKPEYMKSFTYRASSILHNKVISSLFQPGALKILLDYSVANDGHYKPIQLEDFGWRGRCDPMFALSSVFFFLKPFSRNFAQVSDFLFPLTHSKSKINPPPSARRKKNPSQLNKDFLTSFYNLFPSFLPVYSLVLHYLQFISTTKSPASLF